MRDGVLVIDKPAGPTSHDIVQRVKRLIRAAKVGHLGTLDPAATGVLPLAINGATKRAQELSGTEKIYEFTLWLGTQRDTDDDAGEVIAEAPVPPDAVQRLVQVIPRFQGDILQRPPSYSAVKVGGVRSYRRARQGEEVRLELRPIHIEALTILGETPGGVRIRLSCRSGTYVRSLARDLALAIGTVGHAGDIRRYQSGRYTLEQALTLEELERDPAGWGRHLIPAPLKT